MNFMYGLGQFIQNLFNALRKGFIRNNFFPGINKKQMKETLVFKDLCFQIHFLKTVTFPAQAFDPVSVDRSWKIF